MENFFAKILLAIKRHRKLTTGVAIGAGVVAVGATALLVVEDRVNLVPVVEEDQPIVPAVPAAE